MGFLIYDIRCQPDCIFYRFLGLDVDANHVFKNFNFIFYLKKIIYLNYFDILMLKLILNF